MLEVVESLMAGTASGAGGVAAGIGAAVVTGGLAVGTKQTLLLAAGARFKPN